MHDLLILGGGPAGLAAALYATRYGLDVCLLEELYLGGQIVNAAEVENYPGYPDPVPGGYLADSLEKQVRRSLVKIAFETVKGVDFSGGAKKVRTSAGAYEAKTVIVAMGQNPRPLGVEREQELRGKGVSYCATCDGNFFRGKDVAVAGGGDTAVTEASFLSRICRSVHIIHRRSEFRAAKAEVDKLSGAGNVHFVLDSQVAALKGDEALEAVGVKGAQERDISVSALFVAIGSVPNTVLFKDVLQLDSNGYIIADENMGTGVDGVFAAGDIRRKSLRQVATATADGAIAAHSAMLECLK
jgi:thioredoxin reductase (NADPH)